MSEVTKELHEIMYGLLVNIRDNADSKDMFSKLGDANFDKSVENIVHLGLVTGIVPRRVASGKLTLERKHEISLTEAGIRFIADRTRRDHH
jgi:predicted HicB family RNase H-like nuclease